ncbi:MAG: VCBS repeat-containing protein [Planctomycetaceae bacterium]|nr:VCBS repeat-containing protein [Planctomycetaceae bacterium]
MNQVNSRRTKCLCFGSTDALLLAICFVLACSAGCKKDKIVEVPKNQPAAEKPSDEVLSPQQVKIEAIADSENLLQALSPQMKTIVRSLSDSEIDVSGFIRDRITHVGLGDFEFDKSSRKQRTETTKKPAVVSEWPIDSTELSISWGELLAPLLSNGQFEDGQIGVLKGAFLGGRDKFEMKTKLEGKIRDPDGYLVGVKGYQTLTWQVRDDDSWELVGWRQTQLKLVEVAQPLFENVTDIAIPDEATRTQVQKSSHQEMILKFTGEVSATNSFKHARNEYKSFDDWESAFQYPSVSVLDLNQDGFDDLFVTDRWSQAQLLQNKGDGTFEDVTQESGLLVNELANCTCFFDFDNDGDSDAFVGRSMGPSLFFENQDGTFKPHAEINEVLAETRFVLAVSVADVNRDGLLDLYLSTYAYGQGEIKDWFEQTTRVEDRLKTRLKIERAHTYVDRGGPPNILLMNRGDSFEWAKIGDDLKQFRDSYQSVWTDLDQDGDLDVYICNDFSPDVFLRNDTERGTFKPEFTDVTQEVAGNSVMGFAMGASWGDFDNDGDLDLYVSNMYSKAGLRIVDQLDDVNERLRVSAHGNFLYVNDNGKLSQVAGSGEEQQHVSSVGWSYGGQFADFNNDGELDIYVASGFYSPPKEVANDKDL